MENDVAQSMPALGATFVRYFSMNFRNCSMPTRSKNLVISSFCDITIPRESQRVKEQIEPIGPHKSLVLRVLDLMTFTS